MKALGARMAIELLDLFGRRGIIPCCAVGRGSIQHLGVEITGEAA